MNTPTIFWILLSDECCPMRGVPLASSGDDGGLARRHGCTRCQPSWMLLMLPVQNRSVKAIGCNEGQLINTWDHSLVLIFRVFLLWEAVISDWWTNAAVTPHPVQGSAVQYYQTHKRSDGRWIGKQSVSVECVFGSEDLHGCITSFSTQLWQICWEMGEKKKRFYYSEMVVYLYVRGSNTLPFSQW